MIIDSVSASFGIVEYNKHVCHMCGHIENCSNFIQIKYTICG